MVKKIFLCLINNDGKILWALLFGLFGALLDAGLLALVRVELGIAGQLFGNGQIYNTMVTAHAFLIIFFIVIPILIGGFGN